MKIIAVGDIHGRNFWQNFINESYDKLVFVGDYFDPYDSKITPEDEIENFKNILAIKSENPDRVKLLIGNHDYHYLLGTGQMYSRYNVSAASVFSELLENAIHLLQVCYVYRNVVFNHAGLTNTWCHKNNINLLHLEASVNKKFIEERRAFAFLSGIGDTDGSDVRQSPFWVRPAQLLLDKIADYKQVVGHTRQPFHKIINGVAFIDVVGTALIMEDVDSFDWKISR